MILSSQRRRGFASKANSFHARIVGYFTHRMQRLCLGCGLLIIVAVFTGCSDSPSSYEPLAKIVDEADEVVLYEGLPHHTAEKELLAIELAEKKTFSNGEFSFYSEPMPLSKQEAAALTDVFNGADAFSNDAAGSWGSKCGPYHPDFAIDWKSGDSVVRIEICFGCGESKVNSEPLKLYLSLATEAEDKLRAILKDHWQHRPKSELAKMWRF
jgi:hypothetical protein